MVRATRDAFYDDIIQGHDLAPLHLVDPQRDPERGLDNVEGDFVRFRNVLAVRVVPCNDTSLAYHHFAPGVCNFFLLLEPSRFSSHAGPACFCSRVSTQHSTFAKTVRDRDEAA